MAEALGTGGVGRVQGGLALGADLPGGAEASIHRWAGALSERRDVEMPL